MHRPQSNSQEVPLLESQKERRRGEEGTASTKLNKYPIDCSTVVENYQTYINKTLLQ